jgi:uncharacterized protein YqgQ
VPLNRAIYNDAGYGHATDADSHANVGSCTPCPAHQWTGGNSGRTYCSNKPSGGSSGGSSGSAYGGSPIGNFFKSLSDKRLKNTIIDVTEEDSNAFDQLRPVSFKWNHSTNDTKTYGFVAQEVQELYPTLVNDEEEFLRLYYFQFIPLLVKEIQQLKQANKDLQKREEDSNTFDQLRPVSFKWNHSTNDTNTYGFVAQEVQELYPTLVNEEEDFLRLDYIQFIPLLVKEIQQLKQANKDLQKLEEESEQV